VGFLLAVRADGIVTPSARHDDAAQRAKDGRTTGGQRAVIGEGRRILRVRGLCFGLVAGHC